MLSPQAEKFFIDSLRRFENDALAPCRVQLAATIALEHFAAILANQLLSNPKITEGMHPAIRPLWIWHAVEETEHEAVCFDEYQQIGGGYWNRVLVMARDRKLFAARDCARFPRFGWGGGGFMRAAWPEPRAHFRRDFHPWQADNHELIAEWAPEHGPWLLRR